MSYTPSLMLEKEKCKKISSYLNGLSPNMRNAITLSKISENTDIGLGELGIYVDSLIENNVLLPYFGLCCNECGMIYEYFDDYADIEMNKEYYCHCCEENKKVSSKDVVLMFLFKDPNDFFQIGQNNAIKNTSVAAQNIAEIDYIDQVVEISKSIREMTKTVSEIYKDSTKRSEKIQKEEKKNDKIKVIIKAVYLIVVLIILGLVMQLESIEENGERIEMLIFILSFVAEEFLNYALEKCL